MTFTFDPALANGATRADFIRALYAENARFTVPYAPVYRNKLLNLQDTTSPVPYRDAAVMQDYATLSLPNTERACTETAMLLSHEHMLGDDAYINQLLNAIDKVSSNLVKIKGCVQTKA